MSQTTGDEPKYTTDEIHDMTVKLLADVLGEHDEIVKAMKKCGQRSRKTDKFFYCNKVYSFTRMLCPKCHLMRHRLARSLFLLGSCQLKMKKETAFYDIVITPKEAFPTGDMGEIMNVLDEMLTGLNYMDGFSYLAFQELTLIEGPKPIWPHLHVMATRPIEERPEPDTPRSEDLLKLNPIQKIQAFSEWQRHYATRYDFDFNYQEPRLATQAFDRLNYLAKPLARSWIKIDSTRFKQELQFLIFCLEANETQIQMIRAGGIFEFPDLYNIDLDELLNNHNINESVNVNDRTFKERGQFLAVVVAYWLELTKGYEPGQVMAILKLKDKERRFREWKERFSHEALALLVRAGFITWKKPDWNALSERDRKLIHISIDEVGLKGIHERVNSSKSKRDHVSRSQLVNILQKYELSTEGKRRLARVILGDLNRG